MLSILLVPGMYDTFHVAYSLASHASGTQKRTNPSTRRKLGIKIRDHRWLVGSILTPSDDYITKGAQKGYIWCHTFLVSSN